MSDGKVTLTVSEKTEQCILMSYPHLTKDQVKLLFIHGHTFESPTDSYISKEEYVYFQHFQTRLFIPNELARALSVDTIIDLVPGEDGIFYQQKLNK